MPDLQHHHEEKVQVGHSMELFKQCHGQESQGGVLVAAHNIVLETKIKKLQRGTRDAYSTVSTSQTAYIKKLINLDTVFMISIPTGVRLHREGSTSTSTSKEASILILILIHEISPSIAPSGSTERISSVWVCDIAGCWPSPPT